MSDWHILRGKEVIPASVDEYMEWIKTEGREARTISLDVLDGDIRVSTIFMGLDHRHGYGLPLVFETMIFGGPHGQFQRRYSEYDEAVDGHKAAVKLATSKP